MSGEIGLISDTHGLMRPDVHTALAGVALILHAGDVGGEEVLDELELIAPVRAVFGNTDPRDHRGLTDSIDMVINGLKVHVSHGHEVRRPAPLLLAATYPDADVIVYGHTHRQLVERLGKALIVNPGAAGARRFDLEPSVARLRVVRGRAEVTLIPLAYEA